MFYIVLGNRYLSDIGAIKSYLVPSVYRRLRPLWCLLFYLVISYLYDIRGEVHVWPNSPNPSFLHIKREKKRKIRWNCLVKATKKKDFGLIFFSFCYFL